jgi:hypothetical protein
MGEAVRVPVGCAIVQVVVGGLSPQMSTFDHMPVHVGFVMDKMALRHVSLRVLHISLVNFIQPVLHAHSSITDAI